MGRRIVELGLKGRTALVPASSKGIGYGVAKVLAMEGCRVAIASRRQESIAIARKQIELETANRDLLAVTADLTVRDDVYHFIDEAEKRLGPVDILAYNTGPPKLGTFQDLTENDWETAVNLLLMNAIWMTKRVLPGMVDRKWGRLVYITSDTLKQPLPNLVLSNTVRISLAGLSKSLAVEYGSKGITSNGIMQGHILTDRQREVAEDIASRTGQSVEDAMKGMVSQVPTGRYGSPEEVGNLVAFLASDKASYINGTMLTIDGGLIKSVF